MEGSRPWITGQSIKCQDIPNLDIVNGDGTKSFVEIDARMLPEHNEGRWGKVKQKLWVEAERGQELDWRVMAIATLGAMQYALENPDRQVHLIRYWYRPPTQIV